MALSPQGTRELSGDALPASEQGQSSICTQAGAVRCWETQGSWDSATQQRFGV